jgi:GTPase SAR1 family protein
MDTKRTGRFSDVRFRVLVLGRANAGKTSILQRVCDTTESPKIYRRGEEVRSTNFVYKSDLTADQVKLNLSMDVSDSDTSIPLHLSLNAVSARRAHHRR